MNLLIKFPTRQRPEKFFEVLSIYQRLRTNENTRFLITLDTDDPSMIRGSSRNILKMWGNVDFIYGKSLSKIHAVNRDMDHSGKWDVLLLASDDMIPQVKGYDQIILDKMAEHYPDTDGVLWFNDGYVGNRLNTLSIMGRKYYDRFGYIYHPDYTSLFCDNEFQEVSQMLNKVTYFDQTIIKHEHPMNNKRNPMDASYRRTLALYEQDKLVYERRKLNNFDVKTEEVK